MERLWAAGSQSMGELHAHFERRSGHAYTTIHTELAKLVRKKLVTKRGRYGDAVYHARVARDRFVGDLVRDVLRGLLAAHGPVAVHGFADLIADDEAARAELERRLHERREGRP